MHIPEHRKAIDRLDLQIVRLLNERTRHVLAIGEMLTATAMGHFEHEIAAAVVLSLFLPLVLSSGGNSGSQASTLIVRSLALSELELRDWWRVFMKELASGLALGAWLGASIFDNTGSYTAAFWTMAICSFIALVLSLMMRRSPA